jgi:outer membrane protein TolC
MYRILLITVIVITSIEVSSQGVDSYIDSVRLNNPQIIAINHMNEVSHLDASIGILPPNPEVSFGYYPGHPSAIGNKTTWSVAQSFDFPTSYSRIKRLKNSDLNLAMLESAGLVNQILTDARSNAIMYISLQKKMLVMAKRLEENEKLSLLYNQLLNAGEVNILDYNKIELQNISFKSEVTRLQNEINRIILTLDYLSGGNSQILDNCDYPIFTLPDAESIIDEKRAIHPDFLIPMHKIEKAKMAMEYEKTGRLPGVTIGFGSEIVANESFAGPIVGLSIPIWENRGKVEAAKARITFAESEAEAEIMELSTKINSQVISILSFKSDIETVGSRVSLLESKRLLDKALESGDLSVTDYFTELREYYEIEDLLIELSNNYHLLLSDLWDHQLLNR